MRARGRLALHAVVQDRGAGTQFPRSGYTDRTDSADGGGRAPSDGKAGEADLARRALRSDLPKDGVPVFGVHASGSNFGWSESGTGRGGWSVWPQPGNGVSDC